MFYVWLLIVWLSFMSDILLLIAWLYCTDQFRSIAGSLFNKLIYLLRSSSLHASKEVGNFRWLSRTKTRWHSHMARIYSNCSTHEITNYSLSKMVFATETSCISLALRSSSLQLQKRLLAMGLCLSITSRNSTKKVKHRITQTTPHNSPGSLVFWCHRSLRNSTGITPYWGAKCRWGGSKSVTFDK